MSEAPASPTTQALLDRANSVLIGNYARLPIVMSHGEGSFLWDADGKKYIDLFAGFGGCILGHCHSSLIHAATEQAKTLWHVGNTYHTVPQIELGDRLNKTAFTGQAFFCHSGLEANEAAVKLARLRGASKSPQGDQGPHPWKIISLNKSFHGRSLAMIAATGNPAVRAGFAPQVAGFCQVETGNFDALAAAVDHETAGIILEPIQGEGGINLYPPDYAAKVRRLCDERGLTLIFDEVWTGCGRTGRWFGHQHFRTPDGQPVLPDIMTLGKAVGGGLPVGVMFAKPEIAALLVPGKHGCTLGGNPICMAVARTIFDVIEDESLLEHAAVQGERIMKRLRDEPKIHEKVQEVRGRGLMIGVELKNAPDKFVLRAAQRGVILNVTAQKVVRLAPPINIAPDVLDRGLDLVIEAIAQDA
jgi:predicted acetylornithine/succinylornithine family transaminase